MTAFTRKEIRPGVRARTGNWGRRAGRSNNKCTAAVQFGPGSLGPRFRGGEGEEASPLCALRLRGGGIHGLGCVFAGGGQRPCGVGGVVLACLEL